MTYKRHTNSMLYRYISLHLLLIDGKEGTGENINSLENFIVTLRETTTLS